MLLLLWAALPATCGCARLRAAPELPQRNSLVLDQLVIFSNSPLPQHHRLLEELQLQRALLSNTLNLRVSDEPINVYLFPTSDELEAYMRVHFPELPPRRAFFVESDTRLTVYAYWGDRVAEDLRHEVAHGYLHAVVPHLPLWLDEGLAEYFEVPRGSRGLNRPHVDELAAEMARGWRPSLERLETLSNTGEMTQSHYAESWAWIHFMLETTPERRALLQSYLQSLVAGVQPEPLSARLRRGDPNLEQQLRDHLAVLRQAAQ
jgi:hypothetical protein